MVITHSSHRAGTARGRGLPILPQPHRITRFQNYAEWHPAAPILQVQAALQKSAAHRKSMQNTRAKLRVEINGTE